MSFDDKKVNGSDFGFDDPIRDSFSRDLFDLIADYVVHKNLTMDEVKSVLVQKVNTIDLASSIVKFKNRWGV